MTDSTPSAGRLRVDVVTTDGVTVVTVEGEIDLDTIDGLSGALAGVPSSGQVDVDLGAVTYIDSAGLRSLLTAKTEVDEGGGALQVTAASSIVERLIEIAGVATLLYER